MIEHQLFIKLGCWLHRYRLSEYAGGLLISLCKAHMAACAGNELSPTTSYDDSSGVAVNLALEDLTAGQNSTSADSPRIKSSDSNVLPPLSPPSKAQSQQPKAQPAAETQSSYRYLNPLGVFGRVSEALRRCALHIMPASLIIMKGPVASRRVHGAKLR